MRESVKNVSVNVSIR